MLALQIDEPVHVLKDAAADCLGVARPPDTGNKDPELVPAKPRHKPAFTDGAQEARGCFLEKRVADRMAKCIVDRLEPIEVEHRDSERAAGGIADRRFHRGDERAAIGQTR